VSGKQLAIFENGRPKFGISPSNVVPQNCM